MMKNGFILFTVLLLNLILSLVVLSSLQALLLYGKMNNQVVSRHQQYYELEALAYSLAKRSETLQIPARCIFSETSVNQALVRLHQQTSCSIVVNDKPYNYLLSDLGIYPCLTIKVGDKPLASHHWLISVASRRNPFLNLQIRVAWPEHAMACTLPVQHQINAGVVSSRSDNSKDASQNH